jgi:hypothetical protein
VIDAKSLATSAIVDAGGIELIVKALASNIDDEAVATNACGALWRLVENGSLCTVLGSCGLCSSAWG